MEVGEPIYIGSAFIDDPRYRGEKDCIMTTFFALDYLFGSPNVSNEEDLTENIESYHWVDFDKLSFDIIQEEHYLLMTLLLKHLGLTK